MGWFRTCGEFIGSATSAYIRTSAKLQQQELVESSDFCPNEAKKFIAKSLEECRPINIDLTRVGRIKTKRALKKDNYFATLLAIDSSTKSTKRALCIVALKTAAKCICSGYDAEDLRAVTYSYLALRQAGFD